MQAANEQSLDLPANMLQTVPLLLWASATIATTTGDRYRDHEIEMMRRVNIINVYYRHEQDAIAAAAAGPTGIGAHRRQKSNNITKCKDTTMQP